MVDILMTRQGHHLVAYDAVSAEELDGLGNGPFIVTVKKPRSLPQSRLYWACIMSMVKSGGANCKEDVHSASLIKTGSVAICKTPSGDWIAYPQSTAFTAMKQEDYRVYFDAAIRFWRDCGLYEFVAPELRARLEAGER